jgi:hypothetical protein
VATESVGTSAFNWRLKVCELPLAVAVSVAACFVATGDTLAEKPTLVALAGTVTDAGTDTAASPLDRLTTCPAAVAAVDRVTVHGMVPDPVIDALLHDKLAGLCPCAVPVPVRKIDVVGLVGALLVMVIAPDWTPAVVGSNSTSRVATCPGLSVSGVVVPIREKPVPVTVAVLI